MRAMSFFVLVLSTATVFAEIPPEKVSQLRDAVTFPNTRAMLGIGLNTRGQMNYMCADLPRRTPLSDPKQQWEAWQQAGRPFLAIEAIIDLCEEVNDGNRVTEYAKTGVTVGEEFVREHPQRAEAWILLGDLHCRLNQRAKAKECYEQAVRADRANPLTHRALAVWHANQALTLAIGQQHYLPNPLRMVTELSMKKRQAFRDAMLGEKLDAINTEMVKATDAFDWGTMLAKNDARSWLFRSDWQQTLATLINEETDPTKKQNICLVWCSKKVFVENHIFEDVIRASKLTDDPKVLAYALFALSLNPTEFDHVTKECKPRNASPFFHDALIKLSQIQRTATRSKRLDALRAQAVIEVVFYQEYALAHDTLAIVKAPPDDLIADQLAMFIAHGSNDYQRLFDFMERRCDETLTPIRVKIYVRACLGTMKVAQGLAMLKRGHEQFPNDLEMQLGYAAGLLQYGKPADLPTVGQIHAASEKRLHELSKLPDTTIDVVNLQKTLRHNHLIWLTLSNRSAEIMTKLREWNAFTNPDCEALLTHHQHINNILTQNQNILAPVAPLTPAAATQPAAPSFLTPAPMSVPPMVPSLVPPG